MARLTALWYRELFDGRCSGGRGLVILFIGGGPLLVE